MRHLQVLALCGVLAGCEPVAPQGMSDIEFGPEASLDAHHRITFAVAPDAPDAELDVRLADGQPLYQGPARIVAARARRLKVPRSAREIVVTATVDGVATTTRLPVTDGEVQWR